MFVFVLPQKTLIFSAMKKIALTCGDPAGVGPEIISRWLAENPAEAKNVTAIGPKRWLNALPCAGVAVREENFEITPGVPSSDGQRAALAAMERAAAGTLCGEFSAVVTAPVNKAGLKSVGYNFPGQTEFFAARWGGVPVMAFAGGKLSVVLATWHIPLRDVPAALTEETLSRAVEQAAFLARKTGEADSGRFALGEAASRRFPGKNHFYNPMSEVARRAANLPHWEQQGKTYFVTFRLADSVPADVLKKWTAQRDAWLEKNPLPHDENTALEYHKLFGESFEKILSDGHGSCCLRRKDIHKIVEDTLLYFDGKRYIVYAFVVMPNHVHVLFRALENNTLADIVYTWKSFSAKAINKVLGREGTLWQKEYWDRIVRNEHHFQKCVEYIFENPGKLEIPVFLRFDAFPGECAGNCEAAGVRFSQDEVTSRRVSCSIGVCGLNPHAGEQGILGREEIEIIEPVLKKLRTRFPGLSHCVPADTIFARQLRGEFDVVVALYHDQALAPLKTVEFDEAVNISLGLPYIRTSPDHGTAYDIAGKGIAQIRSFANAVKMAKLLSS